jgi:hypothetical protein
MSSRNLLPRLRRDTNLPALPVGRWSVLQDPAQLARIEFVGENESELRTRIQSIPNPWARIHLFRHALEDPEHPARRLVQNDFLDALELAWSLGTRHALNPEIRRVPTSALRLLAEDTGSPRVRDFADALVELAPRQRNALAHPASALPSITLLLLDGQPVLGSSPYTLLFTAEDAGRAVSGEFFGYAAGAEARPLAQRQLSFQRYVAQVVFQQLSGGAPATGDYADWTVVQQCVTQWLTEELAACRAAAPDRVKPQLAPRAGASWREAAAALKLEPLSELTFGGLVLFRRTSGELPSRWRLRAPHARRPLPIVVDPTSFDGRYHEGGPPVQLPPDLRRLERDVLPGSGQHEPWVAPAVHWLTDRILLLSDPLDTDNVKGLGGYRLQGQPRDPRFAQPRLALPLRGDFFRYFTPAEVDRILTVEVMSQGGLRVTLRVPVGSDDEGEEVVIDRFYPEESVRRDVGPQLVLWPSFHHPEWHEYALFRIDRVASTGQGIEIEAWAGLEPLPSTGAERRAANVGVQTFGAAPEVLELRDTAAGAGDRAEALGVVLPGYRPYVTAGATRWYVGVDFGTSNTLVAIRENDHPTADVFHDDEILLPLTRASADSDRFLNSYFFPGAVAPAAFGTALYHLRNLPTLNLDQEPVGLRATVPFDGRVENDADNLIAGNLKWTSERGSNFLAATFLRHLAATVLSSALRRGVAPENVRFTYSYPRAFQKEQVRNLSDLWTQVKTSFAARGLQPVNVEPGPDESRCVLQHFFTAGLISESGAADVVVDVGGGTTDVAAYGGGRTLILDSIHLGGRNLTGGREQAASAEGLRNPFVDAFVRWAAANDFPETQRPVLEKYLKDGQVHLAFTYLVRSEWYRRGDAGLFRSTPAGQAFQLVVFYVYAAVFHHLGLSFRALHQAGHPVAPFSVTFAGNGSQYLRWLGDTRGTAIDPDLRTALVELFEQAAGIGATGLKIEISERPKEEVASGLVALGRRERDAGAEPVLSRSVVGEAVSAVLATGAGPRTLAPTDPLAADERFGGESVKGLDWIGEEMEIERFHRAAVHAARRFAGQGMHWTEAPGRLDRFFASLGRAELRQAITRRLDYLAAVHGGFSGSLFVLGVSGVVERMLDGFMGETR